MGVVRLKIVKAFSNLFKEGFDSFGPSICFVPLSFFVANWFNNLPIACVPVALAISFTRSPTGLGSFGFSGTASHGISSISTSFSFSYSGIALRNILGITWFVRWSKAFLWSSSNSSLVEV